MTAELRALARVGDEMLFPSLSAAKWKYVSAEIKTNIPISHVLYDGQTVRHKIDLLIDKSSLRLCD